MSETAEDVRGSTDSNSPTQYEKRRRKLIAENYRACASLRASKAALEQEEWHVKPLDTDPDGINEDDEYIDDGSDNETQEERDEEHASSDDEEKGDKEHAELLPEPEVRY